MLCMRNKAVQFFQVLDCNLPGLSNRLSSKMASKERLQTELVVGTSFSCVRQNIKPSTHFVGQVLTAFLRPNLALARLSEPF